MGVKLCKSIKHYEKNDNGEPTLFGSLFLLDVAT